jgi:cytochrome P450 family 6
MQESFIRLKNYMDALLLKNDYINCNDVTTRLTADIIGNLYMNVDMNMTLSTETNEMNEFLNYSNLFRGTEGNQLIKKIFGTILPQLYDLIGYRLFRNDKMTNFYTNFIVDLMKYRRKHNIVKSDFVDMLMQLKNNSEKLSEKIGKSLFILVYLNIVMLYASISFAALPANYIIVNNDNYIKINKFK